MVTTQGLFVGLVFMRTSKSLLGAYSKAWVSFKGRANPDKAAELKEKRFQMHEKRKATKQRIADMKGKKSDAFGAFVQAIWILVNTILMFIVGIWVWTPMEFLSENMSKRKQLCFACLRFLEF